MTINSGFENAYALIIGISKYKDPRIPELRFTRADAEGIFKLLTDPKISGLKQDNIKTLFDDEATRFNIKNAISSWLFKIADKDSIVFIFFAGHGGIEEDRLGVERDNFAKYMLPYDTVVDDLYSSSISNRDFNELLLTIRSKKLVIFMDSCYSGGVSERKARDVKITDDPYQKLAEGEGRIVIAASQPNQLSFEDSRIGHGVFTYNLLEALSGKADWDNDGYVSILDAYKYLQDSVPKYAMHLAGGAQEPILRGDITKDFVISVNRERREEIEIERDREKKLKKLKDLYLSGKVPAKLYERLRIVAKADMGSLQDKDRDIAKLIIDFNKGDICIDTFIEDLVNIVPEPGIPAKRIIEQEIPVWKDVELRKKVEIEVSEKEEKEEKEKKAKKEEIEKKVQKEEEPLKMEKKEIKVPETVKRNWKYIVLLTAILIVLLIIWPSQQPLLPQQPPRITSAMPASPVRTEQGSVQTFIINLNQSANVTWLFDDIVVQNNENNVMAANYTKTSVEAGIWNVKVIAKNPNGSDYRNWTLVVPLPTFTNSIGMEFIQIPAGEFEMGSGSNEIGRLPWEGPLHNVEITKSFYIGKYEVTNKQWFDIMGYSTSISPYNWDNLPVVQVSWDDASKFIKTLNEKERTNKYRLPSEAEWEYAARAGTTSRYSFGDNESMLVDYAWYGLNAEGRAHPIGQKKPNRWELYDIHGNVWEWVQDKLHDYYDDAPTNGSAWINGTTPYRVVRGGSLNSLAEILRSASRTYEKENESSFDIGFRLVKDM
ncbi:MAG: SUMF1/EgtB/PvdO family nonheme iron enzyme [Methanococcaceae archaeon]